MDTLDSAELDGDGLCSEEEEEGDAALDVKNSIKPSRSVTTPNPDDAASSVTRCGSSSILTHFQKLLSLDDVCIGGYLGG